jgi:hypothetical protein
MDEEYWDVELTASKYIPPVKEYILSHGGTVTDVFDHEGSSIYLMRVFMTRSLATDVSTEKGVYVVEKPPRYRGQ